MPEWGIALLLALASLLWSLLAITSSPGLSRYDEWTYLDYSYQVASGHVPVQGDDLSEFARQEWSCRGMEGDIRGVVPPPCNEVADHPVTDWPFNGENYNTFHPPLYFGFAGLIGSASETLGGNFTDGARFASALFGAAGAACLYLAIRSWNVGRWNSVGATLMAMSAPALAQASAIVHNDAISMLAGAGAVWLSARIFKNGNHGWILPLTLAALVSATRTMSVIALLAVGIIAGLVALFQAGERWHRLRPALGIALGTTIPYLAWTVYQNSRRPSDYIPSITGLSTEPFEPGDALAVLNTIAGGGAPWGLTSPAGDWYLHPDLNSGLLEGWSWILYVVFLLLIPVGLYVAIKNKGAIRWLALAIVILPALTALVVQAREILSNDAYFRAISGRYAITAVPVYTALIAVLAQWWLAGWEGRWPVFCEWALFGAGIAGYTTLLLSPLL